jgi:hypothetical protein
LANSEDSEVILRDLNSVRLEDVNCDEFNRYLFIFDSSFLDVITPLNFAYFAKYTIEEVIILPILAITQNTPTLRASQVSMHSIPKNTYFSSAYFAIEEPRTKNQNSFCFVSYPNNPSKIDNASLSSYLQSLANLRNDNKHEIRLVLYLPYTFKVTTKGLMEALASLLKLHGLRARLRVRGNRAVSVHAMYESAYMFCPRPSVMVASRHNVLFQPNFTTIVSQNMKARLYYYHGKYMDEKGNENSVPSNWRGSAERGKLRHGELFQKYFRHVQIFRNDLVRTLTYWVLKSGELDFYETEAAFFILAMETMRLQMGQINAVLYRVHKRLYTSVEQKQIKTLKKYVVYDPMPNTGKPILYKFNCL